MEPAGASSTLARWLGGFQGELSAAGRCAAWRIWEFCTGRWPQAAPGPAVEGCAAEYAALAIEAGAVVADDLALLESVAELPGLDLDLRPGGLVCSRPGCGEYTPPAQLLGMQVQLGGAATCVVHGRNLQAVDRLLSVQHALCAGTSVGLRLIQELELLSRGYSIAGVRSALPPITRIEGGAAGRLLVPLRLSMYRELRRCLIASREATLALFQCRPLATGLDYAALYLCMSDLDRLGVCNAHNDEAILLATDTLSLQSLKHLHNLCVLQQSEHYRRFVLSLLPGCARTDAAHATKITVHDLLRCASADLNQLCANIDGAAETMLRDLAFYEHLLADDTEVADSREAAGSIECPSSSPKITELKAGLYQLQRTIRSAAAAAAVCSTNELNSGEISEVSANSSELREHLQLVRAALLQGVTAVDDSLASLVKGPPANDVGSLTSVNDGAVTSIPDANAHSARNVLSDPVEATLVGDLVFEAYTSRTAEDDENNPDLDPDERKRRRDVARAKRAREREARALEEQYRQAQQARRAAHLHELKGVLRGVREEAVSREILAQPPATL